MKYTWDYIELEDITYNVLPESLIKPFLLEWIMNEWMTDQEEFPDQPWTANWMKSLAQMDFKLEKLRLDQIRLHEELMRYKTDEDDFLESLKKRAAEREESYLRGVSFEPLLVNGTNAELMDGYTRHMVLKKHNHTHVYAYVGKPHCMSNQQVQRTAVPHATD